MGFTKSKYASRRQDETYSDWPGCRLLQCQLVHSFLRIRVIIWLPSTACFVRHFNHTVWRLLQVRCSASRDRKWSGTSPSNVLVWYCPAPLTRPSSLIRNPRVAISCHHFLSGGSTRMTTNTRKQPFPPWRSSPWPHTHRRRPHRLQSVPILSLNRAKSEVKNVHKIKAGSFAWGR